LFEAQHFLYPEHRGYETVGGQASGGPCVHQARARPDPPGTWSRASLLGHISEFPAIITADWVHAELDSLDRTDSEPATGHASITEDEWEYARGCNPIVETLNPKPDDFCKYFIMI
jgi:hypothetical protein